MDSTSAKAILQVIAVDLCACTRTCARACAHVYVFVCVCLQVLHTGHGCGEDAGQCCNGKLCWRSGKGPRSKRFLQKKHE